MPPEVRGHGQGQPQDSRSGTGAGDNQAGAEREEPQATQQEGRGPDRHVPAMVPHWSANPHYPRRQAQARLKLWPAPYAPTVKRVAPPPPTPGAKEEAPVEAGRRNQFRVAKQAWGMIQAQTGHFSSSDSDRKPPLTAPRPHRRRGGEV